MSLKAVAYTVGIALVVGLVAGTLLGERKRRSVASALAAGEVRSAPMVSDIKRLLRSRIEESKSV